MNKKFCLPIALQIVTDDVGWFNGFDARCAEGPSRTALPRKHVAEDYAVIEAVGKEIGMKINCPFVIGEWDKKNRLRGMPHATNNEEGWDMASQIDYAEAEKCLDIINKAEYLELAFHGLMHGYWENGISLEDAEFSHPAHTNYKTKYASHLCIPVDNDYFESHVETFFKIYEDWGFKQKIRSFTSPSAVYKGVEENRHLVATMKKYGMHYWANSWYAIRTAHEVIDGIIFLNKAYAGDNYPHWAAYGIDPERLKDYSFELNNGIDRPERGIYGTHWPNLLYFDPERNMECVKPWGRFMKRQAEIFGLMLSKDTAFAASQGVYRRYASLDRTKDGLAIDLAAVDNAGVSHLLDNSFYISIEKGATPKIANGGTISLYEEHKDFNNYKIERNGEKTVLLTL